MNKKLGDLMLELHQDAEGTPDIVELAQENIVELEMPVALSTLERAVKYGPKDREEWGLWVSEGCGAAMGGRLVDINGSIAEGEHSPIDVGWDIYTFMHGRNRSWKKLKPEEIIERNDLIALHAPRGGMKTLIMALIAHAAFCYIPLETGKGYDISWTAKQEQQVEQAWRYFRQFASHEYFGDHYEGIGSRKVRTKEMESVHGSHIWRVTCSIDGLNSKHPHAFFIDEVERMEWSVIAEGMLSAMPDPDTGLPVIFLLGSTQKHPRAIMYRLKKEAKEGRADMRRWSWKSVVQQCPPWRRAKLEGVSCTDWEALSGRDIELSRLATLTDDQETELLQVRALMAKLENNCVIVSRCKGIAIEGSGYYDITKLCRDFRISERKWDAQIGCEQPVMEDAVFEEFGERNLRRCYYNPGAEILAGLDYGYVLDPTTIGIFNKIGSAYEMFMELDIRNADEDQLIPQLVDLQRRYQITAWAVDPSAAKLIGLMRNHGMAVWAFKKDVEAGYGNLGSLVCTGVDQRRLFLNPDTCPQTVMQMATHEKTKAGTPNRQRVTGDNPEDNHHWDFIDMLRYFSNMVESTISTSRELRTNWRR